MSKNEYLEEVEKIIKCNKEVDTDEVISEREIIVNDADKNAEMLYKKIRITPLCLISK